MQLRSLVALIIAVVTAISSHAWAWDAEGHRIIAHLAYERLTPKAKAEIATLIAHWSEQGAPWCPVASLEDASTWPDCISPQHGRGEYFYGHYVDIPICGVEPPSVWCRSGVCVIDDTKRALAILKDPTKPAADRLEALEEVAHFVGDMHQRCTPPTTMTEPACVPWWLSVTNQHHMWDMEVLVNAEGTSESAAEAALEPLVRRNAAKWARGDLDAWVAETDALAVSYVYPKLAQPPKCGVSAPEQTISQTYLDGAAPLVREQLGRAAVRLAVVLNEALG